MEDTATLGKSISSNPTMVRSDNVESLHVRKHSGEKAIRLLDQLRIRDRNLRIRSDNDHILIPVSRSLSESETKSILAELEDAQFIESSFSRKTRYAHSLSEALEEKLSPSLLELLPHSIDMIGTVAIVELPEELHDNREIVGEGIMQINRNICTVLAKAGPVSSQVRTRELSIIAGEKVTETTHREQGLSFAVDVSKVYFSPRLSFERSRVATQVRENEMVVDMFAGVGPFAVQIAANCRKVIVYAIDINPYAVRYLLRNVAINRVKGKVIGVLGDSRFIIPNHLSNIADRVIMNLPGEALRYVETACLALKSEGGILHCYSFSNKPQLTEEASQELLSALKRAHREPDEMITRVVKSTAPHQWQIAVDVKVK